jgi:hypothetical protein
MPGPDPLKEKALSSRIGADRHILAIYTDSIR